MDREISTREKRKTLRKALLKYIAGALGVAAAIVILTRLLEHSVSLDRLSLGTVDRGAIETTISATGKFTPLIEEIIVSPISSRILEVYKSAGDSVAAGEPLLKLELSSIETEYRKNLDERDVRKSQMVQSSIKRDNAISDLEMQYQINDMQLKQLYTDMNSEKYLDSIGASTPEQVKRTELNYQEAKIRQEQLEQKIENERKTAEAEKQVEELQFRIFEKILNESARVLRDARILSPQTATLTFIMDQIGSPVTQGSQIAIISDLSRFKVNAEIADSYASRLTAGARAMVELGSIRIPGTVINITPSIDNGSIKFIVMLDNSEEPELRSGLKCDVYVFHGVQQDALRLTQTKYFSLNKGEQELWVVGDNSVEKRKVKLGDRNYDYIEVIDGLREGDKVVISDMNFFKNKQKIKLKK